MLGKNKFYFYLLFIVSICGFLVGFSFNTWTILCFVFLFLLIASIRAGFTRMLPLGSLLVLMFFIDNTFAVTLIHLIKGDELRVGSNYYLKVPIDDYLPFAFISTQALLLGYSAVKVPTFLWMDYVKNFQSKISLNEIYSLLGLGIIGLVLQTVNSGSLEYVTHILAAFFSCSLIAFALYYKKPTNIYFLIGIGFNILISIRSGMFGSLVYFIVYYFMLMALLRASKGRKINWILTSIISAVGIFFLALLQNVKADYRSMLWEGEKEGTTNSFYETALRSFESGNMYSQEFYLPALFRLNQGYQVSAVLKKVPAIEPFAEGGTIIRSVVDAFVPRVLNPNKEEAGGREKIKRFTDITLIGSTSMNIGILGESYANFGKAGGFVFLFLYGMLLAVFERTILLYSRKKALILILFPIYFEVLFGSGTDFLYVLNTIVKSSLFIFFVFLLFNTRRKSGFTPVRAN
jgi:hypothetical protein